MDGATVVQQKLWCLNKQDYTSFDEFLFISQIRLQLLDFTNVRLVDDIATVFFGDELETSLRLNQITISFT